MCQKNESEFMTTADVAKALRCSLPTARHIMSRPDFPMVRVGKNMKVNRDAFYEWSKKRRI